MLKSVFFFFTVFILIVIMQYSKLQKFISTIILWFFFFGLVFRIPFDRLLLSTQAWNLKMTSLVSFLVEEKIYSWIKTNVKRYAEDIQKELENTKVIIVPIPEDITAFRIASLNERLYYQWKEGLIEGTPWWTSKLVGTVLFWNLPLAVGFEWKKSWKTLLPYVDFENKSYIYNHENGRYEKNRDKITVIQPEIWHWVMSPNTGKTPDDIRAINEYLDKNHEFYTGQGNFKSQEWTTNWVASEKMPEEYKPYVFYFDQFRELKALNYNKFVWYEAFLKHKEDLIYNKFSKELANDIQDNVAGTEKKQVEDLINDLDHVDHTFLNAEDEKNEQGGRGGGCGGGVQRQRQQ